MSVLCCNDDVENCTDCIDFNTTLTIVKTGYLHYVDREQIEVNNIATPRSTTRCDCNRLVLCI